MAVTWIITNTDRHPSKDGRADQIHTLYYDVTDSETVGDDVHTGRYYGSVSCPDPSGSFIAYSDVTEENCIAWAKALIGDDAVKEAEESVAMQISHSKNPIVKTGVPWNG